MDDDRKRKIAVGVKRAWDEGRMAKVSDTNRKRWQDGTRKPRDPGTGAKISAALRKQYESGERSNTWLASKTDAERSRQGKAAQAAIPQGAKHPVARWWDVRDPSGRTHRFRNLNQFLRDHAELFDPEDLIPRSGRSCRASKGIQGMFAAAGTSCSWKGWTPALINHEDADPLDRKAPGTRR